MATTMSQSMSTTTKNNDKQPRIGTINLWISWVEETHAWLPRAMIFWFLSIEKRTNQISQSWERMLNDLYIRLKRRFQTLKPILWMTVTLFSAIFWSGSVDKGFFSTRPTWRSCLCQVCPISASQDGELNFLFTFSKVTCTWPGFQQTMVFSHDLERTKSPNQRQQST